MNTFEIKTWSIYASAYIVTQHGTMYNTVTHCNLTGYDVCVYMALGKYVDPLLADYFLCTQ